MKKILLIISLLYIIILSASCALEHNNSLTSSTDEDNNTNIDLSTLTVDDCYKIVAELLYGEAFSDIEYANLYTFLKGVETGSIFNSKTGIGSVNNGVTAGVILQSIYYFVQDAKVNNTDAQMLPFLEKTTFSDTSKFNAFMADIAGYNNTALVNMLLPVTANQNTLLSIEEMFLPMLLDASSSASKGSNTSINISMNDYNVIANSAYVFAAPMFNLSQTNSSDKDIIASLLSVNLYNLSSNAKYKLTYNQSLKFFRDSFLSDIAPADQLTMFNTLVSDAVINNGKVGGEPYKNGINDAVAAANPYNDNTVDYALYPLITKTLYGAPYDEYYYSEDKDIYLLADNNPASNQAVNNTLTFYQKVKSIGLKVPVNSSAVTITGYKTIAEIIAIHLKNNGFMYSNFNVSTDIFQSAVMDVLFPSTISETAPVCQMIKEFNKNIDEYALSDSGYTGAYDPGFSDAYNPCNITIE